jgi:translation initiation factor IF-2
LSTVRVYKVASILDIKSQDVIVRLRRDHGIDVKSPSSSIEEVVARQFIERVAKELGLSISSKDPLSKPLSKPTLKTKKRKVTTAKSSKTEKPAIRPLPPPRLVKVKSHKPTISEEEASTLADETAVETASAEIVEKTVETQPTKATPDPVSPNPGRIIPSKLRLRVEDADSSKPADAVIDKPTSDSQRLGKEDKPQPKEPSTTRPKTQPRARQVTQTASPRVAVSPLQAPGPKPLPSQPARPARPGGHSPRPAYRPTYRGRPGGRPGGRKRTQRPTQAPVQPAPLPEITRTITLAEGMTVKDLAEKLELRAKDVLKKLIDKRIMMTINNTLDTETATTIAREFGADVTMRTFEEEILHLEEQISEPEDLVTRAPVVTVMGHVDHGKTTLLDAIRETRVAEREAGGITQHIGAYTVKVNNQRVIFLDTPGHEAFTLMRARGAGVTDVVVLVVAADDGVMPQTKEAIDHAKAAAVPIIVAVNKIDKADANSERVKKELAELELTPEEWGGKTVTVEVSAKKKQNLDALLEMIILVTELGELKANPKRKAAGTVLEAKLDRGRGPVATILVQDGTLRVGDTCIAGTITGKVRALLDDRSQQIKEALPSTPVEVLGLSGLPKPGDTFQVLTDATKARQVALVRQEKEKARSLGNRAGSLTLESLQQQMAEGHVKELPIIIKADVQGSTEVLGETLAKLSNEDVKIQIIHAGVGAINESDILLASASNAIVIGFNVRPDRNARDVAEREHVDVRLHTVIYKISDEIQKSMSGLLEPTDKELRLGAATVRETFKVPKFGLIAGCMVTEGRMTREGQAQARLVRDNVLIHEGRIGSLKRFKDDVKEVKSGLECGIAFDRFNDIKVGDVIEAFTIEKVAVAV